MALQPAVKPRRIGPRRRAYFLWRAGGREGEVLESVLAKTRDRKAALRFLLKLMRRYGSPNKIVTDCLRSKGAALRDLGIDGKQDCARHTNNRAENSPLPFRRRERAMLRFRRMRRLQTFVAVHA